MDALAAADGLVPGLLLADARALVPGLTTPSADPVADRVALTSLAQWVQLYTPQAATDGIDGLILDITGCAHLWDGEAGLLADLGARLDRGGITHRLGVADSPAAAWGWARFRSAAAEMALPDGKRAWPLLLSLPMAALRLPDLLVADLARVGLRRVGDLHRQPRAPLTTRYGTAPGRRLDQMLGLRAEPVSPQAAAPQWRVKHSFAEPISTRDAIEAATLSLLRDLAHRLNAAGRGARRLDLICYRTDATQQRVSIGTARPLRDPGALLRLLRERFDQVEPGFGIEMMEVFCPNTDVFIAEQPGLANGGGDAFALTALLDRLVNRLGEARVGRPLPRDTHRPEAAMELVGEDASFTPSLRPPDFRRDDAKGGDDEERVIAAPGPWPKAQPRLRPPSRPRTWRMEGPRPLLLLHPPERVEVAEAPMGLRWRGRQFSIDWMAGPERIRPDWWQARVGPTRDYYRVQLADGRRVWLFRTADMRGHWYLHGLFP